MPLTSPTRQPEAPAHQVLFERMWMALRSAETEWSSEDFALAMMNLQVRVALFMAAKHPERIAAFRAVLDQLEEL